MTESSREFIQTPLYHEIHVSEIKEYLKCRRSHELKYVEQWYPKTQKFHHLTFGTCFHTAKEIYFDPRRWLYDREVSKQLAKTAFAESMQKFYDDARANAGSSWDDGEEQTYQRMFDLGPAMLDNYFEKISPEEDKAMVPIAVEQKFAVVIPGLVECGCDKCLDKIAKAKNHSNYDGSLENVTSLPIALEGKIDLIYKNAFTNKVWMLDWKTTSRFSNSYEWLELDLQLSLYTWALYALGMPVAGFAYHEDLKAALLPPARLDKPYQGRLYSTNKQQATNLELAFDTFQNCDPEGFHSGKYTDYLTWLSENPTKLYNREVVRKTKKELSIVEDQLASIASEIVFRPKDNVISPNKYGCPYCEFLTVCIERQRDSDWRYTLESAFEQREPYYADKEYDT